MRVAAAFGAAPTGVFAHAAAAPAQTLYPEKEQSHAGQLRLVLVRLGSPAQPPAPGEPAAAVPAPGSGDVSERRLSAGRDGQPAGRDAQPGPLLERCGRAAAAGPGVARRRSVRADAAL